MKSSPSADCASGLTDCKDLLLCSRRLKICMLVQPQCVFGIQIEDLEAFEFRFGSLSSVTDGKKVTAEERYSSLMLDNVKKILGELIREGDGKHKIKLKTSRAAKYM